MERLWTFPTLITVLVAIDRHNSGSIYRNTVACLDNTEIKDVQVNVVNTTDAQVIGSLQLFIVLVCA